MRGLLLVLLAAVMCFAAPAKQSSAKPAKVAPTNVAKNTAYTSGSAKILGAVDSKTPFSGDRLFAVLDSVGGTGTWMEWDVNGVQDPSLMEVLDPMLKSDNKPEMVWVIVEREKPLVAVLLQKGRGEVIVFYELKSLDANPIALEINKVLNPDVVFRDYEQISETEFVHRDKSNLKVVVTSKTIHFTYTMKGEEPLKMPKDFSSMTFVEKNSVLRDFEDYFKYEYSLMLRAFIQSTRAVFNWQPWHWYLKEWNGKFMMPRAELEAVLARGIAPESFTLFKAKTKQGESISFKTNGNGFSELIVTRP
ncbi:MAG: hypothetical protein MJY93_10575 [Fibrobacter sp.]|nr:hypothetical protein [Fibrobacter sp.]